MKFVYTPERNPLRDVKVVVTTGSPLTNALEEIKRSIGFTTPAQKNFQDAERRLPNKNNQPHF